MGVVRPCVRVFPNMALTMCSWPQAGFNEYSGMLVLSAGEVVRSYGGRVYGAVGRSVMETLIYDAGIPGFRFSFPDGEAPVQTWFASRPLADNEELLVCLAGMATSNQSQEFVLGVTYWQVVSSDEARL